MDFFAFYTNVVERAPLDHMHFTLSLYTLPSSAVLFRFSVFGCLIDTETVESRSLKSPELKQQLLICLFPLIKGDPKWKCHAH